MFISPGRVAFSDHYAYSQGVKSDSAFVTPTFRLDGRKSNVELSIHTDLDNNWAYFNFALINDQTGQTFDFAREVSYYHDSDGSDGSRNNSVIIPSVPSGQYYLRVEPEMASWLALRALRAGTAPQRAQLRLLWARGVAAADSAGFGLRFEKTVLKRRAGAKAITRQRVPATEVTIEYTRRS